MENVTKEFSANPYFIKNIGAVRRGTELQHCEEWSRINRNKHERFPREVVLLRLFSEEEMPIGFDSSIPPDKQSQIDAMYQRLSEVIHVFIHENPEARQIISSMDPQTFRKRDRLKFQERIATEEDINTANINVVSDILTGTLRGSLMGMGASLNTILTVVERDALGFTTEEFVERAKNSYDLQMRFARTHGKYDPDIQKYLGRFDAQGNDTRINDPALFRLVNDPKRLVDIDREALEDYLLLLHQSNPAKTDLLGCPASYTVLIRKIWDGLIDIYSR